MCSIYRELRCLRDQYCANIAYYRRASSKNWEDYYAICMHLLWHALHHALAIGSSVLPNLCPENITVRPVTWRGVVIPAMRVHSPISMPPSSRLTAISSRHSTA